MLPPERCELTRVSHTGMRLTTSRVAREELSRRTHCGESMSSPGTAHLSEQTQRHNDESRAIQRTLGSCAGGRRRGVAAARLALVGRSLGTARGASQKWAATTRPSL